MEIKSEKEVIVAKLEGGLYVVNGKLCITWTTVVNELGKEMGIERKPRKVRAKPEDKGPAVPPAAVPAPAAVSKKK